MKRLLVLLSLLCFAAGASAGEATLTWDDGPNGGIVRWYDIYEKPKPCADLDVSQWTKVARNSSPDTKEHTRLGLTEGDTYCWRVTAGNNNFESLPSNEVAKTIPFTAPNAPVNLNVQ